MPDWTYQTVFRPVLFRLGAERARAAALGSMGLLSRLPWGARVIQFMGHMRPDGRLAVEKNGLHFATPVGLGYSLDPQLAATRAFAEFGFGLIEIGPIAGESAQPGTIHLDVANETLTFQSPREAITPAAAERRLARDGPYRGTRVLARIEPASTSEAGEMLGRLRALVSGFVVPIGSLHHVRSMLGKSADAPPTFAAVSSAAWPSHPSREQCVADLLEGRLTGILVDGPAEATECRIGRPLLDATREAVRQIRDDVGPQPIIVAAAGIHAPADALDCLDAGADLVLVDSGLVFAGPGLPKRINEAVLYRRLSGLRSPNVAQWDVASSGGSRTPSAKVFHEGPLSATAAHSRAASQPWFWAFLMGLAMFVGGILALAVATTRVVLPYDESMSGLSREELSRINDRLLAFMTHDRVTLAGTMLAVGVQYVVLAVFGVRRGVHWAYVAIVASAFCGFFCFFSFLGFGYFDPFHAFVTAILFQFLLLTVHAHLPPRHGMEMPDLFNDRRWKANQWGQLLFVVQGAVLIIAGLVITQIGMTSVFVHEDLEFMDTTAAELFGAHPQLVPLVAHDRATFGGMLLACGVATLLSALWGFRRGQAWLWWALIISGTVAYWLAILVHWTVGYHSLWHLLPAYGGLAMLWLGGILSYPYLVARDERLEREWAGRLVG